MSSCHEQFEERFQLNSLYRNVKISILVVEGDSSKDKDVSIETEEVTRKVLSFKW